MKSLAVKYRPEKFEDVCSQTSVIKILKRQLELRQFSHCYLFTGPSGCGKTTLARIFAYKINEYRDTYGNLCSSEPIEIDGASNNGVDNVRNIIQNARERSIDGKYKIFIIDECHLITSQAWGAFLKCIEEPPQYSIFIFCTTDPQKIPSTIQNRVLRFNLSRINTDVIKNRLMYICKQEGFINYEESCDYISKLSGGGMRDAIVMIEKCSGLSTDLNINNVMSCLGNFSYSVMFDLTDAIIDKQENIIIKIIDYCYNEGGDLKLFINQYIEFLLDLNKYYIFKSFDVIKIPKILESEINYTLEAENFKDKINILLDDVFSLVNDLKQSTNIKTVITIKLLQVSRKM